MALTITYDGYGVVANADSETADSAGGVWAELGGGTIGDNPDVYLYGSQSIGSQYASKSGYTYFTANTALNFTTTEAGQYIYMWINIQSAGAFLILSGDGFHAVVGSDTSNYYKFPLAGKDDSNGWSGGWKCFVLDINLGQVVGTPDDTAINTFGLWIDTDVSVRADSVFQSQIMCAKGLKVEGTSTTMYSDIVAWCEDYTNRAAGMFQSRGQTYFSLGSLNIHSDTANTVVSSQGSNVEYEKSEYHNGTIWTTSYPTDANLLTAIDTSTNTTIMTDTNVGLSGNDINRLSINTSGATSFTKEGGSIKYLDTQLASPNTTYDGVVFSLYNTFSTSAEIIKNCTFDGSSTVISSGNSIGSGNTFNGTSGVISLQTTNLADFGGSTTINSSGSNHGVDLTNIGVGVMSWAPTTTGFDTGVTGSPITPTSTGNEDIYITATTSSDIDINITTGATIPSVRVAASFTGNVNIVAGLVDFTFTVSPSIIDYEYRIYSVTASGSLAGAVELQGLETAISDTATYTYTYSSPDPIAVQIISQPDHDYEEVISYYTLAPTDQNVTINLKSDINN